MSNALDSITWGTKQPDNVVTVYFVPQGGSRTIAAGETYTSEGFNAYEKAQFQQAFNRIASVSGLSFEIVTGSSAGANADFQMVLDTNEIRNLPEDEQFLGYFNPPGEIYEGIGVFNGDLWDRAPGGDLRLGGFGFVTIVHELLHGLGLAHPHDDGGTSTIMNGVTPFVGFDDYGTNNLNQGVYTAMSYNSGYLTGPVGSDPAFSGTFGYEVGPMALDIAVLQQLYGASARNTGDTIYRLPDANQPGTVWRSIWDTAGVDEVRYDGNRDTVIDLRPATLMDGNGAGGFISAARGIAGGFTVANGVRLEKATGGNGDDRLTGNDAPNILVGRGGNDRIFGAGGNDGLRGNNGNDQLFGGRGNDRLLGDGGNDILKGDDGNDRLVGAAGRDVLAGGTGNDQIFGNDGVDMIYGSWGRDIIYGNQGRDFINGGGGRDVIRGGADADIFIFNSTQDSRNTSAARDVIFDFTSGLDKLNLRGIDADSTRGGNQAFDFIGTGAFTDAGQVKVWRNGSDLYVLANTDNNLNTVEFGIELDNTGPIRGLDFFL